MIKKTALSIAGSDSIAGAGIQADLKSYNFVGVNGVTVITCITAQNTRGIRGINKIPIDLIEKQIDTIYSEVKPAYAKTGMLYDSEIIKLVSEKINEYNIKIIVDPVMTATSGDILTKKDYLSSLKKELIPKAYMITPNIFEAEKITDMKISNIDDVKKACKKINELGVKNVVIKGGHLRDRNSVDIYYDGIKNHKYALPRIHNRNLHGSGCIFSAFITGFLTTGHSTYNSIKKAKSILWSLIQSSFQNKAGCNLADFTIKNLDYPPISIESKNELDVWIKLKKNIDILMQKINQEIIPEVGINIGFALPGAKTTREICAIDGRIIKTMSGPVKTGRINFGSSKHIASIILSAMKYDKSIRSVMNIKYSKETIEKAEKNSLSIGFFNRKDEPKNTMSTMEWGTQYAIEKHGNIPDLIYDKGGIGKEPMIRVLGENPEKLVKRIINLTR